MFLKHNNLIIRNATEKDAEQLALWWNDGKIMAHAGFPNGTGQLRKVLQIVCGKILTQLIDG